MKHRVVFSVAFVVIVLAGGGSVFGQSSAQELASGLRLQLSELEAKQSALQTRLQELDEKLKPENIEQSLAGVGSTRPEELREQKRRELERERGGVQKQIDLLAGSRTRLEASLARADAEAYRQSAAPQISVPTTTAEPTTAVPVIETKTVPATPRRPRRKRTRRVRRAHHVVIQFTAKANPGLETTARLARA
jgi:peptidoglycan hydrolase CwlO-like protein